MKKILYIHHGKGIGGAFLSLFYLLQKIDRQKYYPIILCLYESEISKLFRKEGFEVIIGRGIYDFSHTYLEWFGILNPFRLIRRLSSFIPSIYQTYKIIKNIRPDIVHLNSSTLAPCAIGAKFAGAKVIWHIREPLAKGYFGVRRKVIGWLIEKYSDGIIAISKYDAEQLKKSEKVHIIYNFIDFNTFDFRINSGIFRKEFNLPIQAKTVGMLGGVSPLRGTLEFVRAAKAVAKERDSIYFFIIGWKPEKVNFFRQPRLYLYWSKIKILIRKENLEKRIIFTGIRNDIPQVIAGLDLVVFPSLVPQFARPLIEAGAMKKPVIASNLGGQNEIVVDGETGRLFPAGDYLALSEVILDILEKEDKARAMGEKGYKQARVLFNAEINANETFKVYEEVVTQKKTLLIYDSNLVVKKEEGVSTIPLDYMKHKPKQAVKKINREGYDKIFLYFSELKTQRYLEFWKLILLLLKGREKYLLDEKGRKEKVTCGKFLFCAILRYIFEISLSFPILLRTLRQVDKLSHGVLLSERKRKRIYYLQKIAYLRIEHSLGLRTGGSIAHIQGAISGFLNFGKETLFISTDILPLPRKSPCSSYIIRPDTKIRNLPELPEMDYNKQLFLRASKIFDRENPDLIYQRYSLNNYTGLMFSQKYSIPLVIEYNGSEIWVARNWGKRLIFKGITEKIEILNLKMADLIVVVSEPLKYELLKRGIEEEKILVNPNGFDPEMYSPEINGEEIRKRYGFGDKIVVGFIGTFGPWHGAEVLAKAIRPVIRKNPNIRFLFVGDGVRMPVVKEIIKRDNVEEFVILAGLVPQEEAPKYLAACDILVSPHVPNPDGSRFFGSPTKLFEYMGMGKGIVASNLEQIGEVLEHKKTAWLVRPGDVQDLAEGILSLAEDEDLRNMLGRNGREEALKKYTWDKNVERTLIKLGQVLGYKDPSGVYK
jgi:glycosyltransferase involved in cell wall biosynthesis